MFDDRTERLLMSACSSTGRYHRDMAEVVLDHHCHGIHGCVVGIHCHQLASLGHDLRDFDLLRSFVPHSYLCEVVCRHSRLSGNASLIEMHV